MALCAVSHGISMRDEIYTIGILVSNLVNPSVVKQGILISNLLYYR